MKKHHETYIEGIRLERRSNFAKKLSSASINQVHNTISLYENMEKEFDSKIQEASIIERARLEAEKLYVEELK